MIGIAGPRRGHADRAGHAQVRAPRQPDGGDLRPRQQDRRHDRGPPGRRRHSSISCAASMTKYHFRILRVADFQRELEAYTGRRGRRSSTTGSTARAMTDWCLEKVQVDECGECRRAAGSRKAVPFAACERDFLAVGGGRAGTASQAHRVTVLLRQKAEVQRADGARLLPGRQRRLPGARAHHAAGRRARARRTRRRASRCCPTTGSASRSSCRASRRRSPSIPTRSCSIATRRTTTGSRAPLARRRRCTRIWTRPT